MWMYNLHKGYVPTRDKKCLMTFRGKGAKDLLTYDEAKRLPEFAGILNDNTVLIDVDDKKQYETLLGIVEALDLKCRVYKSTKGGHFLFLNNGSLDTCKTHSDRWMTAIGLNCVDIKLGSRNSYSVLKFNGKDREIIRDTEEYQTVPKWLCPVKQVQDFTAMGSGDGRNQALFNYILTLQSAGFTKQEAIETIQLINGYVLPDPLPERELNTILRDEAFQKTSFFNGKDFRFDAFAKFLISEHNIIRIDGQLHLYKDGIYIDGASVIEGEMIKHIPSLNRSRRAEVLAYLDILIQDNTRMSDAEWIAFKNGIYNIETMEFRDFTPEIIITNLIPHDYNPNAHSEVVDKMFDNISVKDQQVKMLLEEVIGYCFYRRNHLRKSFILTGGKRNGKSTFLKMLVNVLGGDNTSALDLNELGDRFKVAEMFRMLANVGDDIGDEFIPNPAVFKKLVSGDRLSAERKGKDPFSYSSFAKQIFSTNGMPRIKDKSGAVIDRLILVPFDAVFDENDPNFDPDIEYKLRDEVCMEYMINLGIRGLRRVLDNKRFTTSSRMIKELEEYEETNNPLILFFKDMDIEVDVLYQPTSKVFRQYSEFCIANGFKQISQIELTKQIKKQFGYDTVQKRIDGQRLRIFTN